MKKYVILMALLFFTGLASAQTTIYLEDSSGTPLSDGKITVEGINNDYYQQKDTGDVSYRSFFDYETNELYQISAQKGTLSTSVEKELGGGEPIYLQLTSDGSDDSGDVAITLEDPGNNEENVGLRPWFRWSVTHSSSTDLTLYIEEKDYSADKPWNGQEYSVGGTAYRPSNELEPNTQYVWGLEAERNGETTKKYRSFTTASGNDPTISLERPSQNEDNVDRRTSFEWSYSGDEDRIDSATLYVEEKDYSGDRPWQGDTFDVTNKEEFRLSYSDRLDRDKEYVWGLEIEGDSFRDTAHRSFKVRDGSVNRDPEINLHDPEEGEKNVDLSPRFDWSADKEDLQYRFYMEEKDYNGDKPWSADPVNRNSRSWYNLNYDLQPSTWYVWGVEVIDDQGRTDTDYRYFKTREEDRNQRPQVDLESPLNEEVEKRPRLNWDSSDANGDSLTNTVYVEEKDGSWDDPWGGNTLNKNVGSRTYYRFNNNLDEGQTYVWGVEVSDGSLTDTATGEFTIREEPERICDASVNRVNVDENFISEGESTKASITIDNDGDKQQFDIKIESEEETYLDISRTFSGQRTFEADIHPENDVKVSASVNADNGPCYNKRWVSSEEVIVVESRTGTGELTVDVEDSEGDSLDNARVTVENGERHVKNTQNSGRAYFELTQGNYDVRVSKDGYYSEERSINVDSGVRTVYFELNERDPDGDEDEEFELKVRTENEDGERVRNALVRVENGVDLSRRTGSDGETEFDVTEGSYDILASKDGYRSASRTVDVDSDTTRTLVLGNRYEDSNIEVVNIVGPNKVCRGASMSVSVRVKNNGDRTHQVTLQGSGLGNAASGPSMVLEPGETNSRSIVFTNIQGSSGERFSVSASSDTGYDSHSTSVDVNNCDFGTVSNARDISLSLSSDQTLSNKPVKVNGYVDGARGRSEVSVKVNGKERGKVNTQPDGYYQTYIRVEEVGEHSVSVSTDSISANRDLEILPTASVSIKNPPSQAFEGENFELCADVKSQIEPEVLLLRNGEIVHTKNSQGEVCFSTTAKNPGEYTYEIRALTYGTGSSAKANIEVLETGPETTSFPSQIATVESESGIVKTELYNTHQELRRYDIRLEGLPDDWFSTSRKEILLNSGEKDTVYFYVVPKDEGSYKGEIVVESKGSEIYRENITVRSGGTLDSDKKHSKSWFGKVKGLWPL